MLLILGLVAGGVGAMFLAHRFTAEETLKRKVRAARRWKVGELPEGTLGRIVGRAAVLRETLFAPISGRTCVYYVVEVREHDVSVIRTLVREERGVPFVLEDASGRAVIEPEGAKLVLTTDARTSSGGLGNDASPPERAFLQRHGIANTGRVLTYHEAILEIGEPVAVVGAGMRELDPDAPPGMYRDAGGMRLRMTSGRRHPLVISDDTSTTAD